jgi:hypothetical protein
MPQGSFFKNFYTLAWSPPAKQWFGKVLLILDTPQEKTLLINSNQVHNTFQEKREKYDYEYMCEIL